MPRSRPARTPSSPSSASSPSRPSRAPDDRFSGRIAGFGTASGTRVVIGMWDESPLGRFADVMLEDAAGHRLLLAPSPEVAAYVSATYSFDEVQVVPVSRRRVDGGIAVTAGDLEVTLVVGQISWLGVLLRLVPRSIATRPAWLTVVDPVARVLVRGARTAGTAGGGRREYYGVTLVRDLAGVTATRGGVDLGALAPLTPPVRFGFGSAPARPSLVDVVSTIRRPA
ncbi:hypothetical protein [Frigoribacterium sp. PvP032]|uniref:hypothetical protein n=1 Tax=Frigoribacterium sp. PvP032 TaxID=2806589 RepID=UPI001B6080A2|nr:hypothetical protein [Frigoribacterium sp. PvP032]MBP1189953.1 hypothetical protein [Frigoribacterium sp. PvP032]